MWLLCGSCVAPVAPLRLPLRLFCGSSGLVCCSLVLLCGFSVTRLWLLCGSSPLCRCLLCGSYVAAMRLLCRSCCSSAAASTGLLRILWVPLLLPCALLWLLCNTSVAPLSVAPLLPLCSCSAAPLRLLLLLCCVSSAALLWIIGPSRWPPCAPLWLLCNTSVAPLWLLSLSRWRLCGSAALGGASAASRPQAAANALLSFLQCLQRSRK
jgi:hypothetical protein